LVLTQPETPTSPLVPAAPPLANPLRHLSMPRAVSLIEDAQRGIFPALQWI
jgi:hypothetical protein